MEYIPFIVLISGLTSGGILGATFPTNTEIYIRKNCSTWALFPNTNTLGIILNKTTILILVVIVSTAVAVGIMQLGNVYPLSSVEKYTFSASWLMGAAIAKWLRYIYLKKNA